MTTSSTTPPPTVALIGCGPSSMFFLHALAIRRSKLEEKGDAVGLAALPIVTCFERSSGPGGVWRSDRFKGGVDNGGNGGNGVNSSTNMYEALWTNGPKESMEFFDHTYREHFGRAMPAFLPREHVLEYLLTRCTKNNPNFFDSVKFNTTVESVTYDEDIEKFTVNLSSTDNESKSQCRTALRFDICIWAAGLNGKPKIPPSIAQVFAKKEGGFKGVTMHSSQTDSNFDKHVRGKNIVMIGDAYSAEDLTLSAIKLGAESVEIVTRSAVGIASTTTAWPMDKVDVNEGYVPTGVTEDGYGVVLSRVKYDYDSGEYKIRKKKQRVLEDVDTVIFCTGYEANLGMLEEKLRLDLRSKWPKDYVPDDWKMADNLLSKELGDVPLGNISVWPELSMPCNIYRGRLIPIPSMYFIFEEYDYPLLSLDIAAWRTLAQIMGDIPLLSVEEMHRDNTEGLLDCLNDPGIRYLSDSNYKKQWDETIDDDHWSNDHFDDRVKSMGWNNVSIDFRHLAVDALESGYPVDIGTGEKLNKKGEALALSNMVSDYARYDLENLFPDNPLRTFRDCNPSECVSIFTGTRAVPLKCNWLELDGCEKSDIVGEPATEETCFVETAQDEMGIDIANHTNGEGKNFAGSSPMAISEPPGKGRDVLGEEVTAYEVQEEKKEDIEVVANVIQG